MSMSTSGVPADVDPVPFQVIADEYDLSLVTIRNDIAFLSALGLISYHFRESTISHNDYEIYREFRERMSVNGRYSRKRTAKELVDKYGSER